MQKVVGKMQEAKSWRWWAKMQGVIGKINKSGSCLSTKLLINKNHEASETGVANEFNKFFRNFSPELPGKS